MCLDTFGRKAGEKVGMADCHGLGGNQVCCTLICSVRQFNADVLSEEFDALVCKHATKDISDEQEQSVSLLRMHYVMGIVY